MSQPIEVTPWPVRQAERLGLRLAIGRVIDHLWQSTLFAMVVGLLALAFRRNRARVRYALWFSVSVKFLVPFSMVMWLGSVIGSSALAVLGAFGPLGTGRLARIVRIMRLCSARHGRCFTISRGTR